MGDQADPNRYLDDVDDGAGCTEIWEALSDVRKQHSEADRDE